MKKKRQKLILQLITESVIGTQEELLARLRSSGMEVTQATISRDIKELRLMKVMTPSGVSKYATPYRSDAERTENDHISRLIRILAESLLSVNVAGNMIVDILYPICGYPKKGELTTITEGIGRTSGGAVCNVAIDIARLLPDAKVSALGAVGTDDEGSFVLDCLAGANVDTSMVKRRGKTSFTAVMADRETNERTFFQYRGANATFSEADIDWDKMDCDLFHIGYILLLDALDEEDAEYGTKMARLLAGAKAHGIKTSIDVVTESGERFKKLVPPALRYTDYCIINELETQETTGISLRGADGKRGPADEQDRRDQRGGQIEPSPRKNQERDGKIAVRDRGRDPRGDRLFGQRLCLIHL